MKFPKLLFLSIFLMGCDTTPPVKIIDNRPIAELSLIKKFHVADSLYSAEVNEIKKTETRDKQKTELIKFVTDSLHGNAKQWNAFIYSIDVKNWPTDYIEVTLLIPKGRILDPEEKHPDYNNIVLTSKILLNDNSPVKSSLKQLLKGDKVLITGTFEKTKAGEIEIDTNMGLPNDGYIFTNPKLDFKIESIAKQGK